MRNYQQGSCVYPLLQISYNFVLNHSEYPKGRAQTFAVPVLDLLNANEEEELQKLGSLLEEIGFQGQEEGLHLYESDDDAILRSHNDGHPFVAAEKREALVV